MPLINNNSDLSFSGKGKVHRGKAKGQMFNHTPVICENTGQEFISVKLAAEYFGLSSHTVVGICREKLLPYKGLAFHYKPIF